MTSGFDELVEHLLYDVALAGDAGIGSEELERAVTAFYAKRQQPQNNSSGDDGDILFSTFPPKATATIIDDPLIDAVWFWLKRHPDIEITDGRIFTNEERIWQVIAGHGVDHSRIPPMMFACLAVIAAHGPGGILQPDLRRLTGQAKQSVPHRTDVLAQRGYITKEQVVAKTTNTTLLTLRRFSKDIAGPQHVHAYPESKHAKSDQIWHYDVWFDKTLELIKANDGIIVVTDLLIGLGIYDDVRQTRTFRRSYNRAVKSGWLRKVSATVEGGKMGEGTEEDYVLRCLQFMREPTDYDRAFFKKSAGPDKLARRFASGDQVEDDADALDQDDDLDESDLDEGDEAPLDEHRLYPQWTPDLPYTNMIYNLIDQAGPAGISSMALTELVGGHFWRRPLDELMLRLTDVWQHSQPPNLKHLSIVRDTGAQGKLAHFNFRTFPHFQKAVELGHTSWKAVQDDASGKKKMGRPRKEAEMDAWGFLKLSANAFEGDGTASLLQCQSPSPAVAAAHGEMPKKRQYKRRKLDGSLPSTPRRPALATLGRSTDGVTASSVKKRTTNITKPRVPTPKTLILPNAGLMIQAAGAENHDETTHPDSTTTINSTKRKRKSTVKAGLSKAAAAPNTPSTPATRTMVAINPPGSYPPHLVKRGRRRGVLVAVISSPELTRITSFTANRTDRTPKEAPAASQRTPTPSVDDEVQEIGQVQAHSSATEIPRTDPSHLPAVQVAFAQQETRIPRDVEARPTETPRTPPNDIPGAQFEFTHEETTAPRAPKSASSTGSSYARLQWVQTDPAQQSYKRTTGFNVNSETPTRLFNSRQYTETTTEVSNGAVMPTTSQTESQRNDSHSKIVQNGNLTAQQALQQTHWRNATVQSGPNLLQSRPSTRRRKSHSNGGLLSRAQRSALSSVQDPRKVTLETAAGPQTAPPSSLHQQSQGKHIDITSTQDITEPTLKKRPGEEDTLEAADETLQEAIRTGMLPRRTKAGRPSKAELADRQRLQQAIDASRKAQRLSLMVEFPVAVDDKDQSRQSLIVRLTIKTQAAVQEWRGIMEGKVRGEEAGHSGLIDLTGNAAAPGGNGTTDLTLTDGYRGTTVPTASTLTLQNVSGKPGTAPVTSTQDRVAQSITPATELDNIQADTNKRIPTPAHEAEASSSLVGPSLSTNLQHGRNAVGHTSQTPGDAGVTSGSAFRNETPTGSGSKSVSNGVRGRTERQTPHPIHVDDDVDSDYDNHAELPELFTVDVSGPQSTTARTYSKPGIVRNRGIMLIRRQELALSIVRQADGAFPGDNDMWHAFTMQWQAMHNQTPEKHTVVHAISSLVESGKLKKLGFVFANSDGVDIQRHVIIEPDNEKALAEARVIQQEIMEHYHRRVLPRTIEFMKRSNQQTNSAQVDRRLEDSDEEYIDPIVPSKGPFSNPTLYFAEYPTVAGVTVKRTAEAMAMTESGAPLDKTPRNLRTRKQKRTAIPDEESFYDAEDSDEYEDDESTPIDSAQVAGMYSFGVERYVHDETATPAKFTKPRPRSSFNSGMLRIPRKVTSFGQPPEQLSGSEESDSDEEEYTVRRMLRGRKFEVTADWQQLSSAPQDLNEVLRRARSLGNKPGSCSESFWWQFQCEVDSVMAFELALEQAGCEFGSDNTHAFINHMLNQPHTLAPSDLGIGNVDFVDGFISVGKAKKLRMGMPGARTTRKRLVTPRTAPKLRQTALSKVLPQALPHSVSSSAIDPYLAALPGATKSTQARGRSNPAPLTAAQPTATTPYNTRFRGEGRPKLNWSNDFLDFEVIPRASVDIKTVESRSNSVSSADKERLVVAIALHNLLCCGASSDPHTKWDIVAHAFAFTLQANNLRQRWKEQRRTELGNTYLAKLEQAIREPFLEAYARGHLPRVNYAQINKTDWPALVQWVEKNILPLSNGAHVDKMPFDRGSFDERYEIAVDEFRDATAPEDDEGHPQPPIDGIPRSKLDLNAILEKSWIRALVCTTDASYNENQATQKLARVDERRLEVVVKEMVESKTIRHVNKGRQQPGRNFVLSKYAVSQFHRWPGDNGSGSFLHDLASAWKSFAQHFRIHDRMELKRDVTEAETMVLNNLVANGLVRVKTVLPAFSEDFDAPAGSLSKWGLGGYSQNPKQVDESSFQLPVVYIKTASFSSNHGLVVDVEIPTSPAAVPGEAGFRIPFWIDIHGNHVLEIWSMTLRSILHLLVYRPGCTVSSIEKAHGYKLWAWEVELVLAWMEKVGLAQRCGVGNGWRAGEWWFCAFMPEIAG